MYTVLWWVRIPFDNLLRQSKVRNLAPLPSKIRTRISFGQGGKKSDDLWTANKARRIPPTSLSRLIGVPLPDDN